MQTLLRRAPPPELRANFERVKCWIGRLGGPGAYEEHREQGGMAVSQHGGMIAAWRHGGMAA